jgi:flavodoxin I
MKRKELTNMKTAVIYWSGTGNTEAMARAVAEVAPGDLNAYGAIAFGCPAMGAEVLEEMEFQPMFDACKRGLGGKRVALFGSYGWGDGEWMRTWESDCDSAGVNLVCESVICTETPDDAALEACRALGKALVE